jgi:Domain of unknown function (DUF4265)
MNHNHVKVAVEGSITRGVESVPAKSLGDNNWLLLNTPLYAVQLAAGDTIRIINQETGTFEIIVHGGNVAIQFYLSKDESDSAYATANVACNVTPEVVRLGGRLDGQTAGLIVYTIPISAGFPAIEEIFERATSVFSGAQWQYSNVYDVITGQPLNWWGNNE